MEIYFSLGSNLGDRDGNIRQALKMLASALGAPCRRLSKIEESEAWGFEGPAFLDCVACFEIPEDSDPEKILDVCKDIECRLGRKDSPDYDSDGMRVYHSRTIDIDILFLEKKEYHSSRLTIPHRQISGREFVKKPLREIASDSIADYYRDLLE